MHLRRPWIIAIAVLAVVTICVVTAMLMRGHPREVRLPDGTVLRLEKVAFGLRQPYKPGGWFQRTKESVASHLPKKWADKVVAPLTTNKSSWTGNFYPAHTNEPSLNVWLTRINATTGRYENVDVRSAELVDADGCVIGAFTGGGEDQGLLAPVILTSSTPVPRPSRVITSVALPTVQTPTVGVLPGTSNIGGVTVSPRTSPVPRGGISGTGPVNQRSSVSWFSFEVFPRREKEFKLRCYDAQRALLAEFIVSNPVPAPPWPATPAPTLPVAVTNGDVVFKLTGLSFRTNRTLVNGTVLPSPRYVTFSFESLEDGVLRNNRDPVSLKLHDSSGNHSATVEYPYALCTRDPEWILEAQFVGRDDDSNPSWTLRGLAVPGRDRVIELRTNTVLDGLTISVVALGGTGRSVFSTEISGSTTGGGGSSGGGNSINYTRRNGFAAYTVTATNAYVGVIIGEVGTNQFLSVRAVDEQGRQYFGLALGGMTRATKLLNGQDGGRRGEPKYLGRMQTSLRGASVRQNDPSFLFFDLPPDVKTIDVKFQLHRMRPVEFKFKPPGN